jgi:hypothetical protein
LWEVAAGSDQAVPLGEPLTIPGSQVRSVGWARDGDRLLLAAGIVSLPSRDGAVRLWEVAAGSDQAVPLASPLTIAGSQVQSVGWARDGDRLLLAAGITGSDGDGSVRLWHVCRPTAVPRLPGYRSDGLGAGAVDELDRAGEAQAVAELVTARTASPPLAVGLFGDWGEGKSHFLELVRQKVEGLSGSPGACRYVRQVRFNAWHYAEAGLWASLVAELFAQLATPPGQEPGAAQRELSRLTAELVARRRVRERLAAARERRDALRGIVQGTAADWKDLEQERTALEAKRKDGLGLPGEVAFLELQGTLKGLRTAGRPARVLLRLFAPALEWFTLALVFMAAVAFGLHLLAPHARHWLLAVPLLAGAPPVLVSIRRFLQQRAAWKAALPAVRDMVDKVRAREQSDLDVADAEVAALERELQNLTAAGQLAGLIGERAAAGDYRSQLGVMTQIREDFERMAAILASGAGEHRTNTEQSGDDADDGLPKIDRIIIYIDDLDRCPPARVMEMLEAVHLLLAVDLFVVVVAIDPRWLLSAVAAHYRDVLQVPGNLLAGDDGTWASTPAQYLEKIFQVVLTLPPVDRHGHTSMINSLIDVHAPATGPAQDRAGTPGTGSAADTAARTAAPAPPADPAAVTGDPWEEEMYGPSVNGLPVIELSDPLTFAQDEAQLLRLVGPPHLPLTPRSVKRLVNGYGLLTALRRHHHDRDHTDHPVDGSPAGTASYRPYRAGLVLLAALVAYPSLGPFLCLQLHRQAGDTLWNDFVDRLETSARHEQDAAGTRQEDGAIGPSRISIRQVNDLQNGLRKITAEAAEQGLHLPDRVSAWQPWIVPTARLSFPAGQITKALTIPPDSPTDNRP